MLHASRASAIAAFGVVLLGVAHALRTARTDLLRWATALALMLAFGRFLWSNIVLRSDFLWFVALAFLIALAAAIILVVQPRFD